MVENKDSNWFLFQAWKNGSSETFNKVSDKMLSKFKVPFNILCDCAMLPQSEKNTSIDLRSYLTQK